MASTIDGGSTNNSNTFGASNWAAGIFSLGDTALKGYFASQSAKTLAKAPAANTALIVGGVVALALVVLIAFKK